MDAGRSSFRLSAIFEKYAYIGYNVTDLIIESYV